MMTKLALSGLLLLFLSNIYVGFLSGLGNQPLVSMTYHFLGGFFMAMLVAAFYTSEFGRLSQPLRVLTVVAMTVAIGVFLEMAEYLGNQ